MAISTVNADGLTLRTIRRVLLLLLLFAFVGTFVELVLLEHDEDPLQLLPLALLASAVPSLVWTVVRPRRSSVAIFRMLMMLMIATGALGLALHFRANLEFQHDLTPTAAFSELFWNVLAAKAPPALAPAVMAQLGCLGLVYAYRLPVTRSPGEVNHGEDHVAIR